MNKHILYSIFAYSLSLSSVSYSSYFDLDLGDGIWNSTRVKKANANIGMGLFLNMSNGGTSFAVGPTFRTTVLPYEINDPNHYATEPIMGQTMEYGMGAQLLLGGESFKIGPEFSLAYQSTRLSYSGDPAFETEAAADYATLAASGLVYSYGVDVIIAMNRSSFLKLFFQNHIMGNAGKFMNFGLGSQFTF